MATVKTFGSLSRRLNFRANEIVNNVEQKVRRAALKADQTVVTTTPIDTGRARGNWIASLETPVLEEAGETANAQTALDQGRSVINQWTILRGSIFISNSVPYIQFLEEGSSAQAPNGMTKQAIQAAQAEFQRGKVLGN